MITFCFIIELFLVRNWASAEHSSIGQNVIVSMKESTIPIINSVDGTDLSRDKLATILTKKLKAFSLKSQSSVVKVLEEFDKEFESYWITNQIFIKDASQNLIHSLEDLNEVEGVKKEGTIQLDLVSTLGMAKKPNGTEWHLKMMEVEKVWKKTKGEGVIVAIIDSGVRASHETLKDNYVGTDNFGWYDPILDTKEPNDLSSHGTHVMGIIAGSGGIGAAPKSEWMACRASIKSMMPDHAVLACAQFILCPSDPSGEGNCTGLPHLVSNSWGKDGGQPFFEQAVKAWIKVGIKPFFAAGNDGPDCNTFLSPGDYDDVIAVGSTDIKDRLALSSSRGPAIKQDKFYNGAQNETNDQSISIKRPLKTIRFGQSIKDKIKPNIIAPGVNIKSANIISDNSYLFKSGTSMATPAVAGVAALLLSLDPEMTLNQLKTVLYTTTDKKTLSKQTKKSLIENNSNQEQCGGIPDDKFPNNFYGHGRVNAYKAYKKLKKMMRN